MLHEFETPVCHTDHMKPQSFNTRIIANAAAKAERKASLDEGTFTQAYHALSPRNLDRGVHGSNPKCYGLSTPARINSQWPALQQT